MTAAEGFALGVDLGTSHTVAVLRWPDGRTRALLFDGVPLLPSAVYLAPDGTLHVGGDALRMAALDPARLEPNPKRRIDEATVLLGTVEVSTVDVLAAVLAAVARAAVEAVGFLPPAVLTYPASWGSPRRAVLAGAAAKAGWPPPRLVPEPVAAARYFADVLRRPVPVRGCLAVFDFGAGTLDIAVVQNTGNGFAVLGAGGIENLGGLDVDAALVGHLGGVLAGTPVWAGLSRPTTTGQIRDRHRFWEDVRGAKEMLSRTPVAPVPVPGTDHAVHLTREEVDRVAGPLIQRAVQETGAVIHRCGLRPDQLAGLFLVGGSSRLPIVARQLHAQLGIAPTVLEQPELPVAEGALAEPMVVPVSPPPASARPPVSAPPGPPVAPPPRRPWYRRKLAWVAAAAVVAVLVATGVVALLLRNPYDEVTFRSDLQRLGGVDIGGQSFSAALTAVQGDHAYLAYSQNHDMTVVEYDLKANRQVHTVKLGSSSTQWEPMRALRDGALIVAYEGGDVPRKLYGVRWSDGQKWSYPLAHEDQVIPEPGVVVVTDTRKHLVLGLDPGTGHEKWHITTLLDRYGEDPVTLPVVVPADLTAPTQLSGDPVGEYSDGRLVQLGKDSRARIVDSRDDGHASDAKGNIGDSPSFALAYDGRLYVASSTGAHDVSSYDLATLDQPRTTYHPADATHTVKQLAPCGKEICVLDITKSDEKTAHVSALDPAGDNKVVWQAAAHLQRATLMIPFGDGVLVQDTAGGEENTVMLGPDGRDRMGGQGNHNLAARLTNGSALLLRGTPNPFPADVLLSGFGVHRGAVGSIGAASQVRSLNCSWTTHLLICPGDTSFTIWRFAS